MEANVIQNSQDSAKTDKQKMTEKDREDLLHIAQRLQTIHNELNELSGADAIETRRPLDWMALAWIDLFMKMETNV